MFQPEETERPRADFLPLEVITHILEFLPTIEDRKAATMVCKLWHQAYQSPSLRKKEEVVITSNEVFEELYALRNPNRVFSNVCARGVNINRSTRKFWRKYGPFIRNLSINSCDVRELTFVKLIMKCTELESLRVHDCRELFLSGFLLESEAERAALRPIMSHVKSLSLGYNRYLSDSHFVRLTSIFPNLQELLLPGCYISFHSGLYNRFYQNGHSNPSENVLTFNVVHEYIKGNASRLKSLSFSETLIDGEATYNLAMTDNLVLEKLYLRGCVQVTNESLITVSEFQNYLTHLDIALCPRVNDDSLITICTRLAGLKYLSIQGCRSVTDLGVADLWKLTEIAWLNISECEKLTDVGVLQALGTRYNRTLRELYMSHLTYITDKSVTQIMTYLPNLRVLDLGYCYKAITDRAVQSIFLNAKRLKTLTLTMCDKLTDRGVTGIALELPPTLDTPETRLRHFMKTREDFDMAEDDPAAKELREILRNISPSADLRGGCLRHLKGLTSLTLSGCNRITDLSLKFGLKLADLRVLDLSACQLVTAEGLFYVSQYNKALEILNLDNCSSVDDVGVGHVLKGLKRLKSLTLGSNRITNRILEFLGQRTSNLSYLDVRHCTQLNAATVNKIIAYYPRLQVVHFSTKANDFQYTAPLPNPRPRPPLPSFRRPFNPFQ